jgi:hypothetical protein
VFKNDHQFHAFREAVTTEAARRFIPVDKQLELAKQIVAGVSKKQISAPRIKASVSGYVHDAARAQAKIDEEEKRRLYLEERGEEIKAEVKNAMAANRALVAAALRLLELWKECPGHPYFGNIDSDLGQLAEFIDGQFRKAIKTL